MPRPFALGLTPPDWLVRNLQPQQAPPVNRPAVARAAVALTLPLALGLAAGRPEYGALASMGALSGVISDTPAAPHVRVKVFSHLLGESDMTFLAGPQLSSRLRRRFPYSLTGAPVMLPTRNTALRRSLDEWFVREDLHPVVIGEFEDLALLTAFGAAGRAVFPAPTAIVREIRRTHRVAVVGHDPT